MMLPPSWTFVLLAFGLGHWTTCAQSPSLPIQLIDDLPTDLFRPLERGEATEVGVVNFGDSPTDCRPHAMDLAWSIGPDGSRRAASSSSDPWIECAVDWTAHSIDTVRLETTAPAGRLIQLFWRDASQGFDHDRSVLVQAQSRESTELSYDFELFDLPSWGGAVTSLRIDPTATPGEPVSLRRLVALRHRSPTLTAAELGRAWVVDVNSQRRASRLLAASRPLDWTVAIPESGELRTTVAALTRTGLASPPKLALEISGGGADGWTRLRELPVRRGVWQPLTLDLTAFSGPRTLRFVLEADDDTLIALADPTVLSRNAHYREAPSVVMLLVDTLRADRLSLDGYHRPTSRTFDAWVERSGAYFTNHGSAAPWTLPSTLSLFTGLTPLEHGINHDIRPASMPATLATLLRENGYSTLAVTGGGYLHPAYGLGGGFDVFDYWSGVAADPDELTSRIEAALRLLESVGNRPCFLLLHTYEPHFPYHAREPYFSSFGGQPSGAELADELVLEYARGKLRSHQLVQELKRRLSTGEKRRLSDSERAEVSLLYDSGVAFTMEHLAQFLEAAHSRLGTDPVVVLTSDHGEALGEMGNYGHLDLSEAVLRTPLVLSYPPAVPAGVRVNSRVRSIDLLPTIVELLGIARPRGVSGRSLLPVVTGQETGHRPGVSYAASGGYGLSLVSPSGWRYILDNSADASPFLEESFERVGSPREAASAAGSPSRATVTALRAAASAALRERPVPSIRMESRGSLYLNAAVEAKWLRLNTIKVAPGSCECVRLAEGRVSLEVGPGQAIEVQLERLVSDGEVRLHVDAIGAMGTQGLDLRVPTADGLRLARGFDGQKWGEETSSSLAVLSLDWGSDRHRDRSPDIDEANPISEQLRALGYVQ